MNRVAVCQVDEIPSGDRKIIEVDDTSIGVFHIDGEYYAVENKCAHQGGPVCEGLTQGALTAEFTGPGERIKESFSDEVPALSCPWHGWEYDLRTGKHLGHAEYGIATFSVVVEGGTVYVEVDGDS